MDQSGGRGSRQRAAPVFSWSPRPSARTLSLPEQIAEEIGNAIIQGQYEPGQRIQEQEVADNFQVSRGPVREALRILERDGLVQINARRGAQVTQLNATEVNDIFEVRIALIGLAARLAAIRNESEFVKELKAGVERLKQLCGSGDADRYVSEIYKLNILMAETGGNACLRDTIFSLAHQTLRYARLGLSTNARRTQSAANWKAMATAIQNKSADLAQKAAERLVRDSRDMAVKLLREQHDPEPARSPTRAVRPRASSRSARS